MCSIFMLVNHEELHFKGQGKSNKCVEALSFHPDYDAEGWGFVVDIYAALKPHK